MIVRQGERHHQPRDEPAVGPHRLHLRPSHAEDSHFGPVHNRGERPAAEAAEIGNGERPALHVVERELAVTGLLSGLGDFVRKLKNILPVDVTDNRHEQAPIGVDRHADADVLLVDDFLALQIDR